MTDSEKAAFFTKLLFHIQNELEILAITAMQQHSAAIELGRMS